MSSNKDKINIQTNFVQISSKSSNDNYPSEAVTLNNTASLVYADEKLTKKKDQKKIKKIQPNQREIHRLAEKGINGTDKNEAPKGEKNKGPDKLAHWMPKNKLIKCPEFPNLPAVTNLNDTEAKTTFQDKLRACRIMYDFNYENEQIESKMAKTKALNEILLIVKKDHAKFTDELYRHLFVMIGLNLFRNLPRLPRHTDPRGWSPEEDQPPRDLNWVHLKIVYDILFQILNLKDGPSKLQAKSYLQLKFCFQLVNNLAASELEERVKAKQCVHRIYSNYTQYRKQLLLRFIYVCMEYIYEGEQFLGIKEVLELLSTIVSGFSKPLKSENEGLLCRLFLPLYKCNYLITYYQPLLFNIRKYVEKKPKLSEEIFYWLICHWPPCKTKREVCFMQTIEDVLKITPVEIFEKVYTWLCEHLASCVQTSNAQVSTKALEMWNCDYFVALVATHPHKIIRIFLPALMDTVQHHWHRESREAAAGLIEVFKGMDEQAYDHAVKYNTEKNKKRSQHRNKLSRTIAKLEKDQQAKSKNNERQNQREKNRRSSVEITTKANRVSKVDSKQSMFPTISVDVDESFKKPSKNQQKQVVEVKKKQNKKKSPVKPQKRGPG